MNNGNNETMKIIMIISLWLISFIFGYVIITIYNQKCGLGEYKLLKIVKVYKNKSFGIDKNGKKYKINKHLLLGQNYKTVLCKDGNEKIFTANQKNENILNNYKSFKHD